MQYSTAPGPPPSLPRAQPGPGWMLSVLVCATLTALAGAFTVFMVYMRPVLQVTISKISYTFQMHGLRPRACLAVQFNHALFVIATAQLSTG